MGKHNCSYLLARPLTMDLGMVDDELVIISTLTTKPNGFRSAMTWHCLPGVTDYSLRRLLSEFELRLSRILLFAIATIPRNFATLTTTMIDMGQLPFALWGLWHPPSRAGCRRQALHPSLSVGTGAGH